MRKQGWEARLRRTVALYRARAHDWAANNCAHLAGACVEAVSGDARLTALAHESADEAQAAAVMARLGAADLGGVLCTLFPEIAPALAQRGDVGVIDDDGREVIVVVLGQIVAAPGLRCMAHLNRTKLKRAFRIE
jgi:hypothetical protein